MGYLKPGGPAAEPTPVAPTPGAFMFGVLVSLGAVLLEEMELRRYPKPRHLLVLTLAAILENFGYRQLNNLWRVWGTWQHVRKRRDWGEMKRLGFERKVMGR